MSDRTDHNEQSAADDMSQYLQMFLDETEEQLDALVESLLVLEDNPEDANELNETFRLIHSIKGAAGMMGLENITVLTHHLENRFEQFRSGADHLDRPTMNLVLRCIDFLRDCNARLRAGTPLGSAGDLLAELRVLEERHETASAPTLTDPLEEQPPAATSAPDHDGTEPASEQPVAGEPAVTTDSERGLQMLISFEPGLALADLKARLILSRLSEFGEILSTRPTQHELETLETLNEFEVVIDSPTGLEELRQAADVDGVVSVEFTGQSAEQAPARPVAQHESAESPPVESPASYAPPMDVEQDTGAAASAEMLVATRTTTEQPDAAGKVASLDGGIPNQDAVKQLGVPPETTSQETGPPPPAASREKVAETMRVDIGRLENLMNLAGQLVINRARFVQVAEQLRPMLRKTGDTDRLRDFAESVKVTVASLRGLNGSQGEWTAHLRELEAGLELLTQQIQLWDNSRRYIGQVSDAVDQLTRVSDSLQRGVMETRMVPVAPLFNRFKRVVRDLAMERGKAIQLTLRGEKTELDKRMIDELADPLMHLVRNCVDHGLETPDLRAQRGKPPTGTISLEASHSGNNIHIHVRDDGSGIDIDRIKQRLIERRVLSAVAVDGLSNAQAAEYIWHPGLSTAAEVTDISGRGVGMDVVKTRITSLNGTVDVESVPAQGTTFIIRLPLTLAIINSLLVRVHNVIFSIPIDDVREIVSVHPRDIVTVRGKQTFDVRGQFVPLMQMDKIFTWRELEAAQPGTPSQAASGQDEQSIEVVILQAGSRTLGLRVAELLGSQDIVIKSLAENLIHIRGLSGASILGDGTVCLMLDVGAVLDMVLTPQEITSW